MRYTVGNSHYFIQIRYSRSGREYSTFYIPWRDDLVNIIVKKMVCHEHHRVPGDWDDVIQYDGYIFKDEQGIRYDNQYPRASYGQLDDSANWWLFRHLEEGETIPEDEEKFHFNSNFEDINAFLNRIQRGIHLLKVGIENKENKEVKQDKVKVQALEEHFVEVIKKIEDQFNVKVHMTPHVFSLTDRNTGEKSEVTLKGYYDYELVPR